MYRSLFCLTIYTSSLLYKWKYSFHEYEKKNWLGPSDRITVFDGTFNSDSCSFARDLTVSGPVIVELKQLLRYLLYLLFVLYFVICTCSGVLIWIDLKDRMNKWCGNIFIYLFFMFDIFCNWYFVCFFLFILNNKCLVY